ncbi:MAG TPA: hypothetical protein VNN25_15215 [Thermoanaerobaculia bacterium]|nr:hypothetical protein [Thermoanaerobaculia bacterium]
MIFTRKTRFSADKRDFRPKNATTRRMNAFFARKTRFSPEKRDHTLGERDFRRKNATARRMNTFFARKTRFAADQRDSTPAARDCGRGHPSRRRAACGTAAEPAALLLYLKPRGSLDKRRQEERSASGPLAGPPSARRRLSIA